VSALLELDNLSVLFPKRSGIFSKPIYVGAMVEVNLEVNPGEVIALVGESGCGKTTLGRVVTGLQKPSVGEIRYQGKNIWQMSRSEFGEFRKGVQMMMQDSYAALNPMRSVEQSMTAPLLRGKVVKGYRAAKKRAAELMESVGLAPAEQFLSKFPHQLSGGQRQRVCLARAISLNPKLIVADEPVSAVDVSLRLSILNLMEQLNRKLGIAFIYITHDLATARYIANHGRMAVMYLGKVVETGNVLEVLANPRHPYLQALLAAVPIPDPKIAKNKRALPLKSLDMPNAADPPSGCFFHPRCPYSVDKCSQVSPELRTVDTSEVSCHEAERVPKWGLAKAE